ncbi:hypothetical protein QG071_04195 [Kingella kingae]|uniref:hypothetical protein n=1 Tax=Kingella kingae TaxID=504 RepID=UPI0002E4051A|nr:hypothetical protein [Kingella kingae]MDK4555302.1 hypothetical protein [Kingella kingae]MDK4584332.1 hypothetical protein [Kingella kingae]MDK4588350.1 hypothetical protein [Kingella kingae]MDK4610418.1 hypothetical protein [Kingella kingae]MDK4642159.1 hypothetical protein [Kingella kingae]
MNWNKTITAILLAGSAALAGAETAPTIAAATTPTNIDGKKEVAYVCTAQIAGKSVQQKMTAMYGFVGTNVEVVQLKINGEITPGMWRDGFVPMNRFVSQDPDVRTVVWTAMPATSENVDKVDGGKFSVAQTEGAQQSIVLDNCKLDRAATAKLN